MSAHQIERLSRENRKLNDQIKSLTHSISVLENKTRLHDELDLKWAKEREFLNQQIRELRRREEENRYQRQETQNRYLNVLTKMENELEQRKDKYHRLETKIEPLVDHDTVRLKILNQVESIHFLQIQQHKRKQNQLKDQILRLKRQNELHKHTLTQYQIDFQDQKRRLRNHLESKNKDDHLNQMSYEMCLEIENKLRLNYEQARKEADYYKDRYFCAEKRYQERIGGLERELAGFRGRVG